jgi:hypothetical protein
LENDGCTYAVIVKEPQSHGHGHADDALVAAKAEKASYIIVGATEGNKKV